MCVQKKKYVSAMLNSESRFLLKTKSQNGKYVCSGVEWSGCLTCVCSL